MRTANWHISAVNPLHPAELNLGHTVTMNLFQSDSNSTLNDYYNAEDMTNKRNVFDNERGPKYLVLASKDMTLDVSDFCTCLCVLYRFHTTTCITYVLQDCKERLNLVNYF